MGVVGAGGIADDPAPVYQGAFGGMLGGLHIERDFVELVTPRFQVIAMMPLQYLVSGSFHIQQRARLRIPVEGQAGDGLLGMTEDDLCG